MGATVTSHHEQRGDDGEIADAVDGEAVAFAECGDDEAGDGWAYEPGDVDH